MKPGFVPIDPDVPTFIRFDETGFELAPGSSKRPRHTSLPERRSGQQGGCLPGTPIPHQTQQQRRRGDCLPGIHKPRNIILKGRLKGGCEAGDFGDPGDQGASVRGADGIGSNIGGVASSQGDNLSVSVLGASFGGTGGIGSFASSVMSFRSAGGPCTHSPCRGQRTEHRHHDVRAGFLSLVRFADDQRQNPQAHSSDEDGTYVRLALEPFYELLDIPGYGHRFGPVFPVHRPTESRLDLKTPSATSCSALCGGGAVPSSCPVVRRDPAPGPATFPVLLDPHPAQKPDVFGRDRRERRRWLHRLQPGVEDTIDQEP